MFKLSTPSGWLPLTVLVCWLVIVSTQIYQHQYFIPLFGSSALEAAHDQNLSNSACAVAAANSAITYYSAIASAAGSVLGFLITAATIFLTLPHEGLVERFAQNKLLLKLFNQFIFAIMSSAATLVFSLISMFSCQRIPSFVEYCLQICTLLALSLSASYLLQCVHVLFDLGQDVLLKIEAAEFKKKNASVEQVEAKTGPPGAV